jgi:hypothetical protein
MQRIGITDEDGDAKIGRWGKGVEREKRRSRVRVLVSGQSGKAIARQLDLGVAESRYERQNLPSP